MNTTVETFNHLKRDVEQSFQRLHSTHHGELDNLLNHITCTLDDLRKINEILLSSSDIDDDCDFTNDDREDFIRRMETKLNSYKNEMKPKTTTMDTIQLEENDDQIIRQQDEQLDGIHHTIVSLRNLTETINFEIDDHVNMMDNIETNMIHSQNRVQHLNKQTTNFVRNKVDGVGGHTCLFGLAVGLFLAIVVLLLLF